MLYFVELSVLYNSALIKLHLIWMMREAQNWMAIARSCYCVGLKRPDRTGACRDETCRKALPLQASRTCF